MIYKIFNDYDGNDTFTVEAENEFEAALAALRELGWFVSEPLTDEDEEE